MVVGVAFIYIKGYVGIFNGMGLKELYIDFSKAKNKICVIKGDNGSGKSTLENAINPTNETAKDFIPGEEAIKKIGYIFDNGSILTITYVSGIDNNGNRKSTTCTVEKDGVDLNPNHNMNEGREIISHELGVDIGFLMLAQLSSENRGLVDMTPSERKKFINDKIDSLEAYNIIFKKLTKKSSELKSLVKSLSTKIDSIGNIEQIQNTIGTLENTLGELEDRKAFLIANISANKEKLFVLDKDGDIISNYNRTKTELDDIVMILDSKQDILQTNIPSNYENIKRMEISKLESQKERLSEKISDIDSRRTSISKDMQTKQIKLDSMGDLQLFRSTEQRIQEIKNNIADYVNTFKSIGFENYDIVSESEYEMAMEYIDRLNNMILKLRDLYTYDQIEYAFNNFSSYSNKLSNRGLNELKDSLQTSKDILTKQDTLKEACSDFAMIPSDCSHMSDCPFITSIVSAKHSMLSDKDYDILVSNIANLEKDIVDYEADMEDENEMANCISLIKQILNSIPFGILSKFPNTEWLGSLETISSKIRFGGQVDLDCKLYLDHKNLISLIRANKEDLKNLREQLSSISKNKDMIEMLTSDIAKLQEQYNSLWSKKESYISDLMVLTTKIETSNNDLERALKIIQEKDMLKELVQKKEILSDQLTELNTNYHKAQLLNEEINKAMKELEQLNMSNITQVQEEINKYKYKLVLYNDYVKEYEEYNSSYSKIEKIRFYCSPSTGIQTVLMEMYMNGIISVSNDLLKMFFEGQYVLHPFVINEKEFRMPCLGKGIINDDISSMSTSQRCMISMIISFALLRQSTENFGIVKLDEIDGGLDSVNRTAFSPVVNEIMNILNYKQCIMISHNTELNMGDTDVIVLKNTDPNLQITGNVIFDINRGIA